MQIKNPENCLGVGEQIKFLNMKNFFAKNREFFWKYYENGELQIKFQKKLQIKTPPNSTYQKLQRMSRNCSATALPLINVAAQVWSDRMADVGYTKCEPEELMDEMETTIFVICASENTE